ncbi:putative carboxylesterase [Helianthus annuus]|nr:putative carboxylesterase [Helianthus annuus]KAJ0925370.1 putative carboxylesterase [Helianthus annuus]
MCNVSLTYVLIYSVISCRSDKYIFFHNHQEMFSVSPSAYISTSDEVPIEVHGLFRIHRDGRFERLAGLNTIAAGTDQPTKVQSKDVVISQQTNLSARIYIPKSTTKNKKLPTLIYYHGGAFLMESSASTTYHPTLNLITAESNVITVSVDYRLAPESPIPIPYEDSWEAIKWVANHEKGKGPEPWLNDYADLHNVFLGGDSSGANIAHNMAILVELGLSSARLHP